MIFIPLCELCGLVPIFVTPMTRLDAKYNEGDVIQNSFTRLKFPEIMRKVAKEHRIPVVDLNKKSVVYLNSIGVYAAKSISMYLEAGKSPAKMSAGTYAKYRNQIEKVVQIGLFDLDEKGFFNPNASVTVACWFNALNLLSKQGFEMDIEEIKVHYNQPIESLLWTRELLAYFIDAFYCQILKPMEPIPYFRSGYSPLAPFDAVVYRGLIAHGLYFEPKRIITRALCAKYLYFIWGLMQNELDESHEIV